MQRRILVLTQSTTLSGHTPSNCHRHFVHNVMDAPCQKAAVICIHDGAQNRRSWSLRTDHTRYTFQLTKTSILTPRSTCHMKRAPSACIQIPESITPPALPLPHKRALPSPCSALAATALQRSGSLHPAASIRSLREHAPAPHVTHAKEPKGMRWKIPALKYIRAIVHDSHPAPGASFNFRHRCHRSDREDSPRTPIRQRQPRLPPTTSPSLSSADPWPSPLQQLLSLIARSPLSAFSCVLPPPPAPQHAIHPPYHIRCRSVSHHPLPCLPRSITTSHHAP